MNTEERYVAGIDLGGTKIRAGIARLDGSIVAEQTIKTGAGGVRIAEQIVGVINDLCVTSGVRPGQVVATGVGGAGVPNPAGISFDLAPNLDLTADGSVSIAEELAQALGHPVVIENDVNAAALGELYYGIGLNFEDFVFISVGTGIGMGIVSGGRLLRGAHGAAGEIGFLPLGADPLNAANHHRGPLEEVVAGDALTRRYRASAGVDRTSVEIFAAAARGDHAAVESIDAEAQWLATAIAAVAAVLDPAVFVLGGGIGTRKDLLPRVLRWLGRLGAPELDVRISELGSRAPVAGAVRLALTIASPVLKGQPS